MQWTRTGTVTVTNGSATVTGASTLWSDVGTLNPGDIFNAPDGKLYEILTINSNTGITLNSVYLGTSLSAQAYSIMPIGLLPSTLAQSVKTTLTTANTALASTVRYDINSMGLSLTQQQNARTNIAALSALDVGCGYLSKSVAGGVDVTLSAVEASNQMILLTGAITANINVIVPVAQRLFFIYNGTSGAFTVTVKTPAGGGVVVPQGARVMLASDSTSVVNPLTAISGSLMIGASGFNQTGLAGSGTMFQLSQAGVNTTTQAVIKTFSASANFAGILSLGKSGSNTLGTMAATTTETVGALAFDGVNSSGGVAVVSAIAGVGVAAPGASYAPGALVFYTSSAAAAGIEAGRFDQNQNFLIGSSTTTLMAGLSGIRINGSANPGVIYAKADVNKGYTYFDNASSAMHLDSVTGTTIQVISGSAGVSLANAATSWAAISDETLKDIIEPILGAAEKVFSLRTVIGKYKADDEAMRRAFLIAQDVQRVLPEAIAVGADGILSLQYTDTIPLIVAAQNETYGIVKNHESRIAALEAATLH